MFGVGGMHRANRLMGLAGHILFEHFPAGELGIHKRRGSKVMDLDFTFL
jgi:hypothetical protein